VVKYGTFGHMMKDLMREANFWAPANHQSYIGNITIRVTVFLEQQFWQDIIMTTEFYSKAE